MTKEIFPIADNELEMSIDSLSIKEKKEFVILTPEKTVAFGQIKTPARPRFLIENGSAQGITRSHSFKHRKI